MKITKALLALVTVAAIAVAANMENVGSGIRPGALQLYLNATGIQNMFNSLVPLAVALIMQNLTIPLDLTLDGGILYQMSVSEIYLKEVVGVTIKKFAFVAGTEQIQIAIGEIDIDMTMNAELSALYFINFEASAIKVTNMTIEVFLEFTDTTDGLHWHLDESANVSFGNVKITMGSSFLNWLLGLMKNVVNDLINNQVVGLIQGMIDDEITLMNARVDNQSANPYVFNIALDPILSLLGFSTPAELNLTMTKAPFTDGVSQYGGDIDLTFDGHFTYPEDYAGTIYNLPNYASQVTEYPPKIPKSLSQQIWIHDSMMSSLVFVSGSEFFNLQLTEASFQANVKAAYPEITAKYGAGAVCTGFSYYTENPNNLVTFSMAAGITLSDDAKKDNLVLDITCNDGSEGATDDLVLTLKSNADVVFDMHMTTIVVFMGIKSFTQTQAAVMTYDALGVANTDATAGFQTCYQGKITDFNAVYENGWSLMNVDPAMAMLGGLIHNITLSPYITDGWAWAGMYMYADLPKEENPTLEFAQA